jgi:hypothetical protein
VLLEGAFRGCSFWSHVNNVGLPLYMLHCLREKEGAACEILNLVMLEKGRPLKSYGLREVEGKNSISRG